MEVKKKSLYVLIPFASPVLIPLRSEIAHLSLAAKHRHTVSPSGPPELPSSRSTGNSPSFSLSFYRRRAVLRILGAGHAWADPSRSLSQVRPQPAEPPPAQGGCGAAGESRGAPGGSEGWRELGFVQPGKRDNLG